MTDITKTVSHLIESQFPAYYRENGAELVAFIKAYYEFLESTDKYSIKLNRQMFELSDIDESLNAFVIHFQNSYLSDFPSIISSNKRFAIKHILDLYSSKGSKNSLELLMKLLYNEEIDVYYPGDDVLKASDSLWVRPQYIEVTKTARSRTLIDKQITGSSSGAKGFVESVITKRVDGKLIDILYLSSVEGQFEFGEKVTDNGSLNGAPTIVGSLTSINVTLGGRNNKIGDILDVISDQAKHGKVRVTEIKDFTGKVDFNIEDGGYGYTSAYMPGTSEFVANSTKVYVSTALLNVNNSANSFIMYEPVLQRIEKVYLIAADDITGNTSAVGSYLIGKNGADSQVANGIIIAVANTNSNGDVITEASSNTLLTVQLIGDTTFGDQKKLTLTSPVSYANAEYVDEESAIILSVSTNAGFADGTSVYQETRDAVNSSIVTAKAIGTVNNSNSSTITLKEAWGTFNANVTLYKTGDTAVNTGVSDVLISSVGARGLVTNVTGSNVSVRVVYGAFDTSKKIRGNTTKLIGTISSITDTGASKVYLNANANANGVIGAPAGKDNVTKLYANGIIVGQNSTAIGIYGNTNPFYYSNSGIYYIETNRETLISPPRYANNAIMELNVPIISIRTGSAANFDLGYLENTETVALNIDLVGGNNVVYTPYLNILLSGENSGIGFVANVTINNGGTLYTNGNLITFSGGGFAGGDPWSQANAYITTDASGVIASITVTDIGSGYASTPTITLPSTSGTVANLSVGMNYGYGFPKNPDGDADNTIADLLTYDNFLIGSIGTLTRINPGSDYNADPFVRVYNPYIAGYGRGDFYLELNNVIGSFIEGETIEQIIDAFTFAKGSVMSYDNVNNILRIHRTSFNVAFAPGIPITGSVSNATANVAAVNKDLSSAVLGDNAIITANVVSANGVATAVEVVDSGFGYIRNGSIILESATNPYVMTGTTNILNQGIGSGYWASTSSHLNSEKKIHDNKYYQEYSYEIISGLSLDKYKGIVKKILHVAGNELFGAVEKRSTANLSISSANSVIIQS